jgi:hypothetical protein
MNNVDCKECYFSGMCKYTNDIALARIKATEYGPHDSDRKIHINVSVNCDYYRKKEEETK